MKALKIFAVICLVSMLPAMAFAGVAGSSHDLQAWAGTSGTRPLCEGCHTPHNSAGDNLWGVAPGATFTGVAALCYTCHDGTVTPIGSTTAFNTALEQHKVDIAANDCSGDANSCHDVHNQGSGKFLTVGLTNGSYCGSCHDATTNAGGFGDHNYQTASANHWTNGTTMTCNNCHTAHGATAQTTAIGSLTNPILRQDNNSAAAGYGAYCISCHNDADGNTIVVDNYNYAETVNNGTETKHPTFTNDGGGFDVVGCNNCHDVHSTGTDHGHLLMANNDNSAYCASCHDGATGPAFGTLGVSTHPAGQLVTNNAMVTGLPALPWADAIDEDGDNVTSGADYAGTTDFIVCETCHSVHKEGFVGAGQGYFLRNANSTANELCVRCHTAN